MVATLKRKNLKEFFNFATYATVEYPFVFVDAEASSRSTASSEITESKYAIDGELWQVGGVAPSNLAAIISRCSYIKVYLRTNFIGETGVTCRRTAPPRHQFSRLDTLFMSLGVFSSRDPSFAGPLPPNSTKLSSPQL
ncbi:hypothetical protein FRC03_001083 [Tulasnella sp. 419]|nr:hypothetical protein FRC03_001083 [Tulasnella sp. 419]